MADIRKKLVIVGDGACGKTSLLIAYKNGEFPQVHVPTLFETFIAKIKIDGKEIELLLWDTGIKKNILSEEYSFWSM